MARNFERVTQSPTRYTTTLALGPVCLTLRYNQQSLGHDAARALWPQPADVAPDFDVLCVSADDPVVAPLMPSASGPITVYAPESVTGQRWLFDTGGGVHTGVDFQRRKALVIYEDHGYHWLVCSPFRTLAQWLASDAGQVLVHAAAVGRKAGGVLLIGPGRAGKSTTALATVAAAGVTAGDDYVWVAGRGAWSCFRTVKTRHSSELTPVGLTSDLPGFDMNYDEPKRVHYLGEVSTTMVRRLPLVGAVIVRQGGPVSAWRPVTRMDALMNAAPSSLFQASADHRQQLEAISGLLADLPCFELTVSSDLDEVGACVLRLVDTLLER